MQLRRTLAFVASVLGIWVGPAHAGYLRLELSPVQSAGLSSAQIQRLNDFLATTESELPPTFFSNLRASVNVSFDLNRGQPLVPPNCAISSPASSVHALGEVFGMERGFGTNASIHLHEGFISIILAGPERATAYPCGHRNTYRLAQATLFHEMMHVYDNQLVETDDGFSRRRLSDSEEFDLVTHRRGTQSDNRFVGRSPDFYEFKNAREQLAVNFEYFMLDPQYACRRPMFFRFFNETLPGTKAASTGARCSDQIRLWTTIGHKDVSFRRSDVRRIDYLLASKGHGTGRFGHSMLRLEICASGSCDGHLEDVVISFAANISSSKINMWKSLVGEYPSQEFIYDYSHIMAEYNQQEFRDLASYPLFLNDAQKEALLDAISETYWEYQGRYKILANNCATETLKLLHLALKDPSLAPNGSIVTPYGLLHLLEKTGWIAKTGSAEGEVETDLSQKARLQQDLMDLQESGVVGRQIKTVEDFLAESPEDQRSQSQMILSLSNSWQTRARAAFVELELATLVSLDDRVNIIESQWIDSDKTSSVAQDFAEMRSLMDYLQPYSTLTAGYGIPLPSEIHENGELIPVFSKIVEIQDSLDERFSKAEKPATLQSLLDEPGLVQRNIQLLLGLI